jgi:hypothetical protein
MSRFILAIIVLMLVVTVAGCNRFPDLSIQVTANLSPEGDCVVKADQAEFVPSGLIDLAYPRGYVVAPRIESYVISNALEFQAEQGNVQIQSLTITILLPDGTQPVLAGDLPNPYNVAASLVIPVNESQGSTAGATFAIAIPTSYRDALLAIIADTGFEQIYIDIRANGTTSGGFSQTSPPFRFPILFCNGCLGVTCEPPEEGPPPEIGDPADEAQCFPGQDKWRYCAAVVAPPPP